MSDTSTKPKSDIARLLARVSLPPSKKWPKLYPERSISLTIPWQAVDEEEERLRRLSPEFDLFNQPAAPHRFVLQSLLGEGDDYHMAYNIDRECNREVTLLFDTEEGALCFKQAPKFAKIASFVDTPRFD